MSMTGGFNIDGKKFDHDRVDQVVELGALEEWTIVNDSPLVHPFHIHVNPFQVTHIDGAPVDEPSYRDTVTVAPARERDVPDEVRGLHRHVGVPLSHRPALRPRDDGRVRDRRGGRGAALGQRVRLPAVTYGPYAARTAAAGCGCTPLRPARLAE